MRLVAEGLERFERPGTRRRIVLAVVLLAAGCGGPAANEAAEEPAEPGTAAGEAAPDAEATDLPAPAEAPPDANRTAVAGTAAEAAPEPQQGAQSAPPPPEPTPVAEEPAAPAAPPHPPGNGRLVIGRAEIARGSGRINGNLFARAVERKRGGLLSCYNVPLGADPALRGSLVVVLVVDPQGMVGVRVEEDDEALAAAGVTSCVVQKLRQVSFSETPPGSELWVRVPLEFKP